MKKSIKHLPKCTQEELNFLLELIPQCISGCEMIILYGSYARGDYVLWDERMEFGVHTSYQSDLDILVVVSKSYTRSMELRLYEKVMKKYAAAFEHRRHALPQMIVEHITTLNKALDKKQYFFTDIIKEGIKIYDRGRVQLTKPHELSFKEIKEIAREEYDRCFPFANEFLEVGRLMYEKGSNEMGAFQLHQACERYYFSIMLVFVNYRPKIHKLDVLEAMAKNSSREVVLAFPRDTDFERHCYELLLRAYIEARYNPKYFVAKEELEYMMKGTTALRLIAERICRDRFAHYDRMVVKEKDK